MKHRYSVLFLPIHLLIDFISLNSSFWLSYQLKLGGESLSAHPQYILLQGLCNLFWLSVVLFIKPYRYSRVRFHAFNLIEQFVTLLIIHATLSAFCWILLKDQNYSRLQLFYFYLIFFVAGSLWRIVGVVALKIYRATGHNNRRYVIVGYGKLSVAIKQFYENHPEMGYQFYGFFDDLSHENRLYLRGDYGRLDLLLSSGKIDCVYCCVPYIKSEELDKLVQKSPSKDYQVKLVIDFASFIGRKSTIEYHDMMPIVSLSNQMWEDVKVKWLKRVFDVCFSISIISLGSPLWVLIALITKLSSRGPVLYSQERIGKGGIAFRIYKFRSMYVDAEQNGPALSSGEEDTRITPWGKFMRKARLDEIPQFYNVLKGDMSVVGPRPERQHFIDQIVQIAPEYINLLQLKPGITSIGQIKYGYAQTVEEMIKRLRYDLLYLKKISLFVDLWLIMQTVGVMIKGKGK